jgi:hypothetical protein
MVTAFALTQPTTAETIDPMPTAAMRAIHKFGVAEDMTHPPVK